MQPLGVELALRHPDADVDDLTFPVRADITLDDARRIIERCSASLDWTSRPDAPVIARRLDEMLTDFPELEFDYSRDALGKAILAPAPTSTRAAALAHIVVPEDDRIFEALLVALARAGNWHALNSKLDRYRPGKNIDTLIARIAFEMQGATHDPRSLPTLDRLGARLSGMRSLAALRLGDVFAPTVGAIFADDANAMAIAGSIMQSRRLIQRYRISALHARMISLSHSRVRDPLRLRRLATLIGERIPLPARAPQKPNRKESSGVVSWLTLVHELEGRVAIPASKFRSTYAQLTKGVFKARTHTSGVPFIFGPYVSMPGGVFTIRFLGEADEALRFELAATCDCGARKLAVMVVSGSTQLEHKSVLGELPVYVPDTNSVLEFAITPLDSYGSISFRGVVII